MTSYELITIELVREALANDKGKEAKLLSWEIKDFTKKGDNLLSTVTSVEVKYKVNTVEYEVSYVAKINPLRPPSAFTEALENFYSRETIILSSIIDGINKFLTKVSFSCIKTPKLYSKSLVRGREAFLTEDLRKKGFKMLDRRIGLDLNHAILVMEELGRFHAGSLVFEETLFPNTIPESFDYFEEKWLDPNHQSFWAVTLVIGALAESTANYLKSYPKYEKCVKWLNENVQNMGQYFLGLYRSPTNKHMNVLIHGDFRGTNILFRYDENNMPIDLRFVDLQMAKKASPAFDILYFYYTSLTGDVRLKHFQKLLYTYYQSFSKVLIFLRKKVPFTFKELEEEVEKKKVFGFVSGFYLVPAALAEGDESYDFGEIEDDKMNNFAELQNEKFLSIAKKEGPFKDRFLSIFDEMIESSLCKEN